MYSGNHESGGGELLITDVRNLSNINRVGELDPGGTIFAVHVEGSTAYVADFELGLLMVDVSNPESPERIGTFYDGGGAINLDVVGDLVYVADRNGGLEIIQISSAT